MSFRKLHLSPEDAERAWFAGLLWKAFPDATSENELAEMAAEVLTTDRRPVTARTVRNGWRVRIGNAGIGTFECVGAAISARKEAERMNGYHENHGRPAKCL